ncbi:hypothetical protein DFH06DRAFT_1329214 [Mycena polygramma]|nr:hypothetical protein DFH06DRAFT_1329214 [Mycena polygramma]
MNAEPDFEEGPPPLMPVETDEDEHDMPGLLPMVLMDELVSDPWSRAQARRQRWEEEVVLLREDFSRGLRYLHWRQSFLPREIEPIYGPSHDLQRGELWPALYHHFSLALVAAGLCSAAPIVSYDPTCTWATVRLPVFHRVAHSPTCKFQMIPSTCNAEYEDAEHRPLRSHHPLLFPMTDAEILALQGNAEYIAMSAMVQHTRRHPRIPEFCTWCGVERKNADLYRCEEEDCFEGLHACGHCIVLGHQRRPFHKLWKWAKGENMWSESFGYLNDLGYVRQHGHDGLPCPNPSPETTDQLVIADHQNWIVKSRGCRCWEKEYEQAEREASVRREDEMREAAKREEEQA